jgi:hypothetical protein
MFCPVKLARLLQLHFVSINADSSVVEVNEVTLGRG